MKGPIVQHNAMSVACQPPTLSTAKNDTIVARFGAEVCAAGHTSVPNLVRRYWSRLGATAGDYLCYETIVEFQRSDAPPQVYVPLLAAALGQPTLAGERRVRQHTAHLVALGLLQVTYTGRANVYDFSHLYRRVAELSAATPPHAVSPSAPPTTDTTASAPPEAPLSSAETPHSERRDSPAYEDVLTTSRFDSIPPDPPLPTIEGRTDEGREQGEAHAIAVLVAETGEELGDVAPRSSRTRAEALRRSRGIDAAVFVELADQARRVVRLRLRKGPPLRRPMAYWFDVLGTLLADEEGRQDDQRPRPPSVPPPIPQGREKEPETGEPTSHPASPGTVLATLATPGDPLGDQIAVTAPGDEIWRRVVAALALTMTPENHRAWIQGTPAALVAEAGGPVLRVTVPNEFHREWLGKKLRGRVEGELARIEGGAGMRVEFVTAVG